MAPKKKADVNSYPINSVSQEVLEAIITTNQKAEGNAGSAYDPKAAKQYWVADAAQNILVAILAGRAFNDALPEICVKAANEIWEKSRG